MQTYLEATDQLKELSSYLKEYSLVISDINQYEPVEMKAKCKKCSGVGLRRELDNLKPEQITEVSVLPMFVCKKCGHKHYSLTEDYLRTLVSLNRHLFEQKELEEIDGDPEVMINTIREYIIRIFASKKISRAEIK